MNLTKLFAASLCLTAMTASAVVLKSDSFEGQDFSGVWVGPQPSAIVAGTNGVVEANSPTNTTDNFVLKLDTAGAVWTNEVPDGTFFSAPIYTDMLVKFVPSETLPSVDGTVKLAIATTNGYLVVTKDNGSGSNVWANTATAIDTSLWYRVTVKLEFVNPIVQANLKIDGTDVLVEGNSIFTVTDNGGVQTLTAIGFQGTGYIDEVVVTTENPFGSAPVVEIALSFTTGELSVLVSGTGTNAAPVVPSGTILDVVAANFYQIAGKSGVTNEWTSLALTNGTITVSADANGSTATFTAQPWTSTDPVGGTTSFANAPATNVAAWAIAKGVTELNNSIYNQYLLNIDDGTSVPSMLITSVAVTNTEVTVTVEATGVDFSTINGKLKLMVSPVLGGASSNITVAVSGTTTAMITQDINTNKFVKAVVE